MDMADEECYFETRNYRVMQYQRHLSDDMYITLCGIEKCMPGSSFGPAKREGYHLHVVFSGKGSLMIDGEKFCVHGGQLFLTVPEKETWYQSDQEEPWTYCWITYAGYQVKKYMEYAGFVDGTYVLDCQIEASRFFTVVQFILKGSNFSVSSELYRMGYAYQYISLAVESWEADKKSRARPCVSTADDYVDYAIQYIADNFKHVKIKEVADYLGINRTYFSMIFRRKMCISPQEYLMKIKMNKGRELLINTDLPVHVISQSIGYENQMTFSKMFKREYGLSPENYRKDYEFSKSRGGA